MKNSIFLISMFFSSTRFQFVFTPSCTGSAVGAVLSGVVGGVVGGGVVGSVGGGGGGGVATQRRTMG